MKFSANLGFLWQDRPLPDAIRAAKQAGFSAVECHWPYDTPADEVKAALLETKLPMLGINTSRGHVDKGENGLSAIPGREQDAHDAIMEAISYAKAIDSKSIHVMAGYASGDTAHHTFIENLRFAIKHAEKDNITILIEPLNRHDAPGYFLKTTDQAQKIIKEIANPRLKLMFDCYHIGRTEGDIITRLKALYPIIGHIQFASVPDRSTPEHGEVNYDAVFATIRDLGWALPLGAEYKPCEDTDMTLGWMKKYNLR